MHLIITGLLIVGAFGVLFLTFILIGKLGGSTFEVVGLALVVGVPLSVVLGRPYEPFTWWGLQALVTLVFFMAYPASAIGKHTKVFGPIVVMVGVSLSFLMTAILVGAAFVGGFYAVGEGLRLLGQVLGLESIGRFVDDIVIVGDGLGLESPGQMIGDLINFVTEEVGPLWQWVGGLVCFLVCGSIAYYFIGNRVVIRWRLAIDALMAAGSRAGTA